MKHLFRAFLCLFVLHLSGMSYSYGQAPVQLPTTYHYYVATTGNDNNSGTQAAPLRTIQAAINKAGNNQAIKVADGTYAELIMIDAKHLQLVGNPDKPESVTINGMRQGQVVQMKNTQSLLCGFTITGGTTSWAKGGGISLAYGSSPVLANLVITDNNAKDAPAIATAGSTNPIIQNTLIYNNNSVSSDAQSSILYFQAGASMYNVTIAHNSKIQTTVRGTTLTVANSILYNPLSQKEIDNHTISYSNIRGGATGTANINADPRFVNSASGNYQLQPNSPCIDAGNPASSWNDVHLPPSQGTARNDMGAYGWYAPAGNTTGPVVTNPAVKYSHDATGNQITRKLLEISRINRTSVTDTSYITGFATFYEDVTQPGSSLPQEDMLAGLKITIYPNPTQGALRVDISGGAIPRDTRISLYNTAGNLLRQWTRVSESNDMDLFDYPAGTYIMHLKMGEHTSAWKIVKQ